jgi:putative transposase
MREESSRNLWMSESMKIYNATLDYLEEHYNEKKNMNKYKIRDEIKKIAKTTIPDTSFQYSVFEAILAFKVGDAKKREKCDVISVDGRCIKKGFIYGQNTKQYIRREYGENHYSEIINNLKLKKLENFNNTRICKLIRDSFGIFYVNEPINITPKNIVKKQFISLDPGIRSFLTYFDGESYGEIGKNFANSMNSLMLAIDDIESKISGTKSHKARKSLRTAQNRLRRKITNKVKDLHYKTINFLSGYENIFLPEFKVKNLAKDLDPKNTRKLMALSHFKFKLRLAQKTSEIGNKVIICNEAYTSKTCTNCGVENNNLGISKIFKCNSCELEHDRDYNGARNIALRVLTFGNAFEQYYV